MNLRRVLSEDSILLRLRANTKQDAIVELVDALVAQGAVKDRDAALKAVLEREQKMSTGMQQGIAIPHGKTDAVDRLVAVVGLKPEGIDFDSMDGQPARIFVMTLSSVSRTGPHIQFLSEISQVLNNPEKREALLKAQTAAEALEILTS